MLMRTMTDDADDDDDDDDDDIANSFAWLSCTLYIRHVHSYIFYIVLINH